MIKQRYIIVSLLVLLLIGLTGRQSAAAGVIYVKADAAGDNSGSSWQHAYTDLQSALGAASSGDQIWVAAGTYKPGAARTDTFQLVEGVALYGGFAGTESQLSQRDWQTNLTILSGDIDNNDTADPPSQISHVVGNNSYHIITGNSLSNATVVEGFIIAGGKANPSSPNHLGGGIFLSAADVVLRDLKFQANSARFGGAVLSQNNDLTMENLTFSHNKAHESGGGLYLQGGNSVIRASIFADNQAVKLGGGLFTLSAQLLVADSTMQQNKAYEGGGMYNFSSNNVTLENMTFESNTAYNGGALYNIYSDMSIKQSLFLSNSSEANGGGIFNWYCNPDISHTEFRGNATVYAGGGVYNEESSPRLSNLLFSGNTALPNGVGAGLFSWNNSHPTIWHATFSGNRAALGGASRSLIGSGATFYNSIFWNNSPGGQIEDYQDSPSTVSYSVVQGGWSGDGSNNISSNPNFVSNLNPATAPSTGGDFHLQSSSPAKDAGSNALVPADFTDVDADSDTAETLPLDIDDNPRNFYSGVDMGTYEYAVPNQAPENNLPAAQTVAEDTALVFSAANGNALTVTDPDAGSEPLAMALSVTNGTLSLGSTSGLSNLSGDNSTAISFEGSLSEINAALEGLVFSPTTQYHGSATLQIESDDQGYSGLGGPLTDSDTLEITVESVNDLPQLLNHGRGNLSEGGVYTMSNSDLKATDVEDEDASLIYQLMVVPQYGTLENNGTPLNAFATFVQGDIDAGRVRYLHDGSEVISDSFAFVLADSDGDSLSEKQFLFDVTLVNDPPVAVEDTVSTIANTRRNIDVLANDVDADSTLSVLRITQPANGSAGIIGDIIRYTPRTDFIGEDSFTYVATDGTLNDSAQVIITVGENTPPVANPDTPSTLENQAVTVDILANDSDPDGFPLTVTELGTPQHGLAVLQQPAATVRYTPTADFVGLDSFNYTVSDGSLTSMAWVTVTVNADTPVAQADLVTINLNSMVTVDVLANDSDPNEEPLQLTAVGPSEHGTATVNNQQVDYTPAVDFVGQDSMAYFISDGELTATGRITIMVNGPPMAATDALTTDDRTITMLNPLANDSDPNGDMLSLVDMTAPRHGEGTAISGTQIIYTPTFRYIGVDTLTYTVSDGLLTATAAISLTILDGNTPPTAADDEALTNQGQAVVISSSTVLTNDTDADADPLTIVAVGPASNGAAMLHGAPSATIVYTPTADFAGTDSFSYTVSDGLGGMATAQVTVQVNGLPRAADDTATTVENQAVVLTDLLANDADVEGDPLTIIAVTQPPTGTVTYNEATITYSPGADFVGTEHFSYTVSDSHGGLATATVTVVVNQENRAPFARADHGETTPDTPVVLAVLANDSDLDEADTLMVSGVGTAQNGTATTDEQVVVYTSQADFVGTDSFTYTVSDGLLSAMGWVTVTVAPELAAHDDFVSAVAGVTTTIEALLNDVGQTVEIIAVEAAQGSLTFEASRIYYTPEADFSGLISMSYTIRDSAAQTSTAMLWVTVDEPVVSMPTSYTEEAAENPYAELDLSSCVVFAFSDLDSDQDLDVICLAAEGTLALWENIGTLQRSQYQPDLTPFTGIEGSNISNISLADYDGDGDLDMLAGTVEGTIRLFANEGQPLRFTEMLGDSNPFAAVTVVSEAAPTLGDLDADGTLELLVGAGDGSLSYYVAEADSFIEQTGTDNPFVGVQLESEVVPLLTDADGDGDLDLLLDSAQGETLYMENTGAEFVARTGANNPFAALPAGELLLVEADGDESNGVELLAALPDGSVTLFNRNHAPTAVDDSMTLTDTTTLTLTVLSNDSDPDADPLSVVAVSAPAHGTAVISGTTILYSPAATYTGPDSFRYTASDGTLSDVATVTLTIETPVRETRLYLPLMVR